MQWLIYRDLSTHGLPRSPYGVQTDARRRHVSTLIDAGFVEALKNRELELVAAVEGFEGSRVVLALSPARGAIEAPRPRAANRPSHRDRRPGDRRGAVPHGWTALDGDAGFLQPEGERGPGRIIRTGRHG